MVKALFDTNILIDYLNGRDEARVELARYDAKAISVITWMDVMVGAAPAVSERTRDYLSDFDIIAIDQSVAEQAVKIRKAEKIRLPDAIIWASAEVDNLILVPRNSKDFRETHPGIRIPYRL